MKTTTFNADTVQAAFDSIRERLNVAGKITTSGATEKMCRICMISYSSASHIFRHIMMELTAYGKVKHVRRGVWEVTRDNNIHELMSIKRSKANKEKYILVSKEAPEDEKPYGFLEPPKPVNKAQVVYDILRKERTKDENRLLQLCDEYMVSVKQVCEYIKQLQYDRC